MTLIRLLNQLKRQNIFLWGKQNDQLGYSFDKSIGFPEDIKQQVIEHKRELIDLLNNNAVHSEEQARMATYLSLPDAYWPTKLDSIQRGMYLQGQIDSLPYTYTIPLFVEFGQLDPEQMQRAIPLFLRKNRIFCQGVCEDLQRVFLPELMFDCPVCEVQAETLQQHKQRLSTMVFPLEGGQFAHFELIHVRDTGKWLLACIHHHMLSDAYSVAVIADEIVAAYDDPERFSALLPQPGYLDYSAYQQEEQSDQAGQQFQQDIIAQLNEAEVPQLRQQYTADISNVAVQLTASLEKEAYDFLVDLCGKHDLTLYPLLFTHFVHAISLFTGQTGRFPVGLTLANRPELFQQAIGPFINTLPIIPSFNREESVLKNAQALHRDIIRLQQNHRLNIEQLVEGVEGGAPRMAELVQILFTLHNFDEYTGGMTQTTYTILPYADLAEKFGVSLIAGVKQSGLELTLTFAVEKYEKEQIEAIFTNFVNSLRQTDERVWTGPLNDLIPITEAMGSQLLDRWNDTRCNFSEQSHVASLLEQQVERTPHHLAAADATSRFTYQQLNARANQLARYLRMQGVASGALVTLCLDRSVDTLISIWAVLKAGAAYIPMEPDFPVDRIAYILRDSDTAVVLCHAGYAEKISALHKRLLVLDDPATRQLLDNGEVTNLSIAVQPTDLAYVIYTSGTTGKPKGVMCEHRGLINRIEWMNKMYPLTEDDRVLQKTPYVFDVSVWELLWANWYGAAIILAQPEGHKDAEYLIELIDKESVSVVHFVPSMLSAFSQTLSTHQSADPGPRLTSLKYLFCSGEALHLSQIKEIKALLPQVSLHNLYGPTEASIDVLFFDCNAPQLSKVLIGKPIDNIQALVLGEDLQLLPPGSVGELHLAGVGLARGYLNNRALTAEKFVVNPYQTDEDKRLGENGRLYKTGDLVYQQQDGSIVYLGRNDFQVKIKGFRIELSEIATNLELHPQVSQAAVKVVKDAQPWLAGYIVGDDTCSDDALKAHLLKTLPEYMIPDVFVRLQTLPVTVNGKLNVNALPSPKRQSLAAVSEPAGELESAVRDIVAKLLSVEPGQLSCDANLYQHGLDSIMAIRLVSQLRQSSPLTLSVKDVFAAKSISALCQRSTKEPGEVTASRTEQGVLKGEVPLLPIQSWFFECHFKAPDHWNQAFCIDVPLLQTEVLQQAINALIERHDVLRMRYDFQGGVLPRQYYADVQFSEVMQVVLDSSTSGHTLNTLLTRWQSGFDLRSGPLCRFVYIEGLKPERAMLFCAFHHLIMDSVSWDILVQDLQALYAGKILPNKGGSYRQWAQLICHYPEQHPGELAYWQTLMEGYRELITHESCEELMTGSQTRLSQQQTQSLLGASHIAFHTQVNDILIAAVDITLTGLMNDGCTHITLEGHGREAIDKSLDIDRTMGWFTSLSPYKLVGSKEQKATLIRCKEQLRAMPNNGVGYGAWRLAHPLPLPQVCFNYLGQIDTPTEKEADWQLVVSQTGQTVADENGWPFAITIFGYVSKGQLHSEVKSRFGEAFNQRLVNHYHDTLVSLIEFCALQQTTEYSASDFWSVASEAELAHLPLSPKGESPQDFVMTEIQKAYLLGRLGQYEIGNVANHVYNEYVYASLDIPRLQAALNKLISLCPVLRSVYDENSLRQRFLSANEVEEYTIGVNHFDDENKNDAALSPVRERLSHYVYDVSCFPLFSFAVSRFEDCDVLHISIDLILLDVQSRLRLYQLLDHLYRGEDIQGLLPTVTFKDYQDHIQFLSGSSWYQRDKAYWMDKLDTLPMRPDLPLKHDPMNISYPKFAEHTLYLDANVWQQFKLQAQRHQLSYSAVLLALYGYLIARFSGNDELLITLTLFNRYQVCEQVNDILGDFTSTSLFHYKDAGEQLLKTITNTHNRMWDDVNHALYNGLEVQRELAKRHQLEVNSAISPIVFTGVVGQQTDHWDKQSFLEDNELREHRYWCAQTSQAWIDLQAVECGDRFMSKWLYVEQLFAAGFIAHLNKCYCDLITLLASQNWANAVPALYLSPEDQRCIDLVNQARQPQSEATLNSAFAEQAQYGERIAVYDESSGKSHSYSQLQRDSDQLAAHFLSVDGPLVAVLTEKGYGQICACLAVMKSGKGYLPLHVKWPEARMQDVLEQAGVTHVVASKEQLGRHFSCLDAFGVTCVEAALAEQGDTVLRLPEVKPGDVAYVIFTSGSTGKPKGVTISHQGAMNTIIAVNEQYQIGPGDAFFALSELSFDLSVYDLFGALAAGAKVVFPAQENTKSPEHWLPLLQQQNVTVWNTVPQLAGLLEDAVAAVNAKLPLLRLFLMSGDWIPLNLLDKLSETFPDALQLSLGGATEGSIWSVWYPIEKRDPDWLSVPYGRAMPNQTMSVLDNQLQPCPVGVTGEIYIGGIGLAQSYWNNEALTQARFIGHPLLGRLYKTGDLGCLEAGGNIIFQGRNDSQVKIRGHRIELGEIENVMSQFDAIGQASVLAQQTEGDVSSTYLVGYYVASDTVDESSLRLALAASLPEYMVPPYLIAIEALPLTANGKLDRSALPLPNINSDHQYCAPGNLIETQLCQLWAGVLNISANRLSVQDDIFTLGCDSVMAIQMVGRLRREMQVVLGLRELFSHRTVAALAKYVANQRDTVNAQAESSLSDHEALSGQVPLLPIQQWFFSYDWVHIEHWNQIAMLLTPELSFARLQHAVECLVKRHDAFALRFTRDHKGEWLQHYQPDAPKVQCHHLNIGQLPVEENHPDFIHHLHQRLQAFQDDFTLDQGPLSVFVYLDGFQDRRGRIFIAWHHLIVDTVSQSILIDDLYHAYQGGKLGDKTASYRQWSESLRGMTIEPDIASFWMDQLPKEECSELINLSGGEQTGHVIQLSKENTRSLLEYLSSLRMQPQDGLAWSMAGMLHGLTGHQSHSLWVEGHGRQSDHVDVDITRTMGWFTCRYPVRLTLMDDIQAQLIDTKNRLRKCAEYSLTFNPSDAASAVSDVDISLNYLGRIESALAGGWQVDFEFSGVSTHPANPPLHLLDVVAWISNGQLNLVVKTHLQQTNAAQIGDELVERLNLLPDRGQISCQPPRLTEADVNFIVPQSYLNKLQQDREMEQVYLANGLQQGMIHHSLVYGEQDEAYRIAVRWDYDAHVDPKCFHQAWSYVQSQFACLRSRFAWQGEIVQIIDKTMSFPWSYHDFSEMEPVERDRAIEQLQRQDRALNYSLTEGELFRVCLVKQGDKHYSCLFNVHHVILDGWSSPILMANLHKAYRALSRGEKLLPLMDDSFAAVQNYIQRHHSDDKDYWVDYLADVESVCPLASLWHPSTAFSEYCGHRQVHNLERLSVSFSEQELNPLVELARAQGITINTLFLFAWHKLLSLYSGAPETVVGTVVSGRMLPVLAIEQAVGMFLNTLPIKHRHHGEGSLLEQIQTLQNAMSEANGRSLVNLSELQSGGQRLFDSLFVFENYPGLTPDDAPGMLVPQFISRNEHRDYPLVLQVEEHDTSIDVYLDFAAEWFNPTKMQQALSVLQQILQQVAEDPHRTALQFTPSIIAGAKLTNRLSECVANNLAQVVAHYAASQPNAPAVRHGEYMVSYAGLYHGACGIAYRLQTEYSVRPGQRVALLMPRTPQALMVLLAIGQLGAVYVPLSYDYPIERANYILQDSQAVCLVTDNDAKALVQSFPLPIFWLSDNDVSEVVRPLDLSEVHIREQDTAYILYTSGTTGKPKGVALSNGAFMATLHSLWQAHFPDKAALKTYSMTSMVFDIFGAEYGLPLLSGGTVTFGEHREKVICCASFDFIQSTPSMLDFTLPSFTRAERCVLLVGGEELRPQLAERALEIFSAVLNVYGPTETCIWSTSKVYRPGADTQLISIGAPLPGEQCLVLDSQGMPLPDGAIGELYIGGTGVAQGYVNRPELNREKFVQLPFVDGTWYRTGDRVRQLESGGLLFMGRQDSQIKFMGHRIEKSDIEQAMLSHPQVRQATVQLVSSDVCPGKPEMLVGYYVPSAPDVPPAHMAKWAREKLPAYMVPEQFIALDDFPVSVSGKLLASALPQPFFDAQRITADESFTAEGTSLAQELQAIWRKLLNLSQIGVKDKFFDLGGNSILLTRMHGLLPLSVQEQVSLIDLFKLPTIASIVDHVDRRGSQKTQEPVVQPPQVMATTDIAIIGMAGRFPHCESLEAFWENLRQGREMISHYQKEELRDFVPESLLNHPNYVCAQSKLDGVEYFDAGFFGYTAKEAMLMDPQHRVFLECVWHALEDANCDPQKVAGDIGVYASVGNNHYESDYVLPSIPQADLSDHYQIMISNQSHFIGTRVAYTLNLTGPAMTIQTACSSSLVAVHQACRALQVGDCQMAIAGGISLGQLKKQGYCHQPGMIFSSDGHCRPFDKQATGTIEGQGVGVVVLKPLESAVEDGDNIVAVIKGSAVNNDGNRKVGFTAPSEERQSAVITKALQSAQVAANDISYIEAHGTGTALGDPIEIAGLSKALSDRSTGYPCKLGSLKSNIGHLDVAAGIAGLIKVALSLQRKTLVPTLHFSQENPDLKLQERGFSVQQTTQKWPENRATRTAGISAFGIGGTNAHVILQEAPEPKSVSNMQQRESPYLLCLSAPDEVSLQRQSKAMADFVREAQPMDLLRTSYTLMHSRRQFDCQRVVIGDNGQELAQELEKMEYRTIQRPRDVASVVFMFPGQGAQYRGMMDFLYENEPVFRDWVDRCLDILLPILDEQQESRRLSREDILARTDRINSTVVTHPALFIYEFALAKWFIDIGVSPDAMIGHSLGEYVAACCAGVMSLSDALMLVIKRGQLLESLPEGKMVSVQCSFQHLSSLVEENQLDIAVVNEAGSCVISGPVDKFTRFEEELDSQGISWQSVNVSRAFHSAMLEPVLAGFESLVSSVELHKPDVAYISNLNGDWVKPDQVCLPQYWVKHLRHCVRFDAGLSKLLNHNAFSNTVFVEVGPGPFLSSLVKRHRERKHAHVISGLAPVNKSVVNAHLMSVVGQLFSFNVPVDVQALWQMSAESRIRLPEYVFARQRYWVGESRQKVFAPEQPAKPAYQDRTVSEVDLVHQVSEICGDILGLLHVDADEDFFELGGDSLAAVQYSAKLAGLLGERIELMQLPKVTVNAIVEAITSLRQQAKSDKSAALIALQQGKATHAPIVLIHPIGGDVYFYRDLVKALPVEYPVYAIRSPMFAEEISFSSLESMATQYLDMLGELHHERIPVFAGASFGGIVAYEMAQQYKSQYAKNVPVVMIDSPFYGNMPKTMSEIEILDYLVTFGLGHLNVDPARYGALDSLADKISYLDQASRNTAYESIMSETYLPRYLNIWQSNNVLMQEYIPKPSRSDILFFAHTEVIPDFPTDQDVFWCQLGHASFKVIPIAGNHLTMNGEESAGKMAQYLSKWCETEVCSPDNNDNLTVVKSEGLR